DSLTWIFPWSRTQRSRKDSTCSSARMRLMFSTIQTLASLGHSPPMDPPSSRLRILLPLVSRPSSSFRPAFLPSPARDSRRQTRVLRVSCNSHSSYNSRFVQKHFRAGELFFRPLFLHT